MFTGLCRGGDSKAKILSKTHIDKFILASEALEFVANIVEGYILKLKSGKPISFENYMQDFES